FRYLHSEHKFHLPAYFVENIGYAVTAFRDIQCVIAKGTGVAAQVQGALIHSEQFPHRDTAVHNIFAMITGVIPTFGDVEAVVTGAAPARNIVITLIAAGIEVPGGARPLGIRGIAGISAAGVLGLNRDTTAVVVEIFYRVVECAAKSIRANVKGVTFIAIYIEFVV